VTFIPEEWKSVMIGQNFCEYGILREYWIEDLKCIEISGIPYFKLQKEEYGEASDITMDCRWQSREFHGESPKWASRWMGNGDTDANAIGARECSILVHRENNRVVGIVCVAIYGDMSKNGAILWIREIAVMPEFQGQGIGRKLIQNALAYGNQYGAKRVFLMADDCNTAAIHLYKSIGFKPNTEEAQIDMIYMK